MNINPDGRNPSESARWRLGGAAPLFGCLIVLIGLAAILIVLAGLIWWLAS